MSHYKALDISCDDEGVQIHINCFLTSMSHVEEVITDLREAMGKCKAFNRERDERVMTTLRHGLGVM